MSHYQKYAANKDMCDSYNAEFDGDYSVDQLIDDLEETLDLQGKGYISCIKKVIFLAKEQVILNKQLEEQDKETHALTKKNEKLKKELHGYKKGYERIKKHHKNFYDLYNEEKEKNKHLKGRLDYEMSKNEDLVKLSGGYSYHDVEDLQGEIDELKKEITHKNKKILEINKILHPEAFDDDEETEEETGFGGPPHYLK